MSAAIAIGSIVSVAWGHFGRRRRGKVVSVNKGGRLGVRLVIYDRQGYPTFEYGKTIRWYYPFECCLEEAPPTPPPSLPGVA